jgi:NADH-quinone oxidoreductase subunit N
MTGADLIALQPLIWTAATVVVLLVVVTVRRSCNLALAVASGGCLAALLTIYPAAQLAPRAITTLLSVDGYALFYSGLILVGALAVLALAHAHIALHPGYRPEFAILVMLAVLGCLVLVASTHFASLFLGLETLSVPLYALIAYRRGSGPEGLEAGMKYLLLAGASSAFLLFGLALLYAETGTLALGPALDSLWQGAGNGVLWAGLMLLIVGVGFKIGVVPFHFWTLDVYAASPPPVMAFIASLSKVAVFALIMRVLAGAPGLPGSPFRIGITVVGVASMLGGNLLALLQSDVRRLLGGSSIAHMGYLLIAALAGSTLAQTAAAYYLVTYLATIVGAIGAIGLVGDSVGGYRVEQYRGLAWERPWLGAGLTVCLLSLAGLPITGGFVGKLYLAAAGVQSGLWVLVFSLVLGAGLGMYYYLRLLRALFARTPREDEQAREPTLPGPRLRVPAPAGIAIGALSAAVVVLGAYPGPLIDLVRAALGGAP